jgi:hypothetical protein
MNFRQNILNTLSGDFSNIKVENGFNSDIKKIKIGVWNLSQLNQFPSCSLAFGNEKIIETNDSGEVRNLDIYVYIYLKETASENLIELSNNIYSDLSKVIYQDENILPDYHTKIKQFPEILDYRISEKSGVYNTDQLTTKVCGIVLNIDYLMFPQVAVDGSAYIPTPVPSILNAYTLTSDFVSSTGFLYNAITGINLSGYSTTDHTHTLINNNLTVNGVLSASNSAIVTNIRTGGGNASVPSIQFGRTQEGFWENGAGIGVVANGIYSSMFYDSGFITRKLCLDTTYMYRANTNIYSTVNDGLAFQTNTTDRLLITSGGNVNIGGTGTAKFYVYDNTGDPFTIKSAYGNSYLTYTNVNNANAYYGILSNGNAFIQSPSNDIELWTSSQKVLIHRDGVNINGSVSATTDITANNTSLINHKHNYSITSISESVTLELSNEVAILNNQGEQITITLPDSTRTEIGKQFIIKNFGTDAQITVFDTNSELIDYNTTGYSSPMNNTIILIYVGNSNWITTYNSK